MCEHFAKFVEDLEKYNPENRHHDYKPEDLFWRLLTSSIIVWIYVQGKDGKEFSLSILANLSDYYSLTDVFDIHSEAQFSMNNRDQWAELGVAKKYLYHEQHVEDLDVDRAPMMMSSLLVDCQSRHWKLI